MTEVVKESQKWDLEFYDSSMCQRCAIKALKRGERSDSKSATWFDECDYLVNYSDMQMCYRCDPTDEFYETPTP